MFETENTLDLVICAQYIASHCSNTSEITCQLSKLNPCLGKDGLTVPYILQLLITSLPSFKFIDPNILDFIESLIDLQDKSSFANNDEIVDVYTFFEDKSRIPIAITQFISLPTEEKKRLVETLNISFNSIGIKYSFNVDISQKINNAELFKIFIKSHVFRINYDFSSFLYTDAFILRAKHSKYADLELLDWIKGFYSPLSTLTTLLNYNYILLDYENILSLEEIVEIISIHIENDKQAESKIIDDVLIPFFQYTGSDAWNCFNAGLLKFGHKCILERDHTNIINNYKILLHLLRHDRLLSAIDQMEYNIKATFVCTILSIIYLCPKAILQVFVYSKEMMMLLRTLKLKSAGENGFNTKELQGLTLDEIAQKISASPETIDFMLNIINIGEILYSNELSFVDIIELENSERSVQFTQLVKFINNEVTYETSTKKWSLFLSSLYSTMRKTSVFNKISIEELSELVLYKLLELKQFVVIRDVFLVDFNDVVKDQYEAIITKHCWQLYMKAQNCDQKIGSLKDCVDSLKLLEPKSHDAHRLSSLIEANTKLLEWKFYLEPGVPITPKDIVELNDPLAIIRRILELNDKAYMYPGDLYYILTLFINGMEVVDDNKLFVFKDMSYTDQSNLLAVKLKLMCLEFSSATDYEYSFNLSFELLNFSIKRRYEIDELFNLISENWFLFFQACKNEYDDISEILVLDNKLKLLGKLLLVVPTEFNTSVLEQWQMLNSQKEQMTTNFDFYGENNQGKNQSPSHIIESSLGDVQSRLQRSLKSSAQDLLNTDSSEIGKNIIGWIVGAN